MTPAETTIAFDVYGTLIDTGGMIALLEKHAGVHAAELSMLWRQKQLEYSFRRGLMGSYRDFGVCTSGALDYACLSFGITLQSDERDLLLQAYRRLPAFTDATAGLQLAQKRGFRLFAFSNGTASDVSHLLDHAGLSGFFLDIISVDELRTFKPDPSVYRHFLKRANTTAEDAWMVSANPFDVIGSAAAGMRSLWIRRSPELIMDPWEFAPTSTLSSLTALPDAITEWQNKPPQRTSPL
ncbi:MAG: haloacid dehalogenase type II [Chlorobiaceae bacterium]